MTDDEWQALPAREKARRYAEAAEQVLSESVSESELMRQATGASTLATLAIFWQHEADREGDQVEVVVVE